MRGAGWLTFTLLTIAVLLAGEAWAYFGHHEDAFYTTSLRRWLGVNPHRWWRQLTFAALAGFMSWLLYHLYAITS